jgi:RNA polymerase sigma-70 factor (ECF subfamily)
VLTRPGETRLGQLLSEHFKAVWRMVRRLGIPPSGADDATQEVFIIAARKLEQIEVGRERQFLLGTALRVAANIRRSRERREYADQDLLTEEVDPRPSAEALLDQKRKRELLDRVLDSLADDLRETFVLVELEGMSGPEVAELIQIPLGTVASRLRRAREAFHIAAQQLRSAGPAPEEGKS